MGPKLELINFGPKKLYGQNNIKSECVITGFHCIKDYLPNLKDPRSNKGLLTFNLVARMHLSETKPLKSLSSGLGLM